MAATSPSTGMDVAFTRAINVMTLGGRHVPDVYTMLLSHTDADCFDPIDLFFALYGSLRHSEIWASLHPPVDCSQT